MLAPPPSACAKARDASVGPHPPLVAFGWARIGGRKLHPIGRGATEKTLFVLTLAAVVWLGIGVGLPVLRGV
jgi:hypothetical protein